MKRKILQSSCLPASAAHYTRCMVAPWRVEWSPGLHRGFSTCHPVMNHADQQNMSATASDSVRRPHNFDYPSNFRKPTHSIAQIVQKYTDKIDSGEKLTDRTGLPLDEPSLQNANDFVLAGRVMARRASGKNLVFLDLSDTCGNNIQVAAQNRAWTHQDDFVSTMDNIRRGDHVVVHGTIGRTKKGELSIFAQHVHLVSSCWHPLPDAYFGVHDKEFRYRNRHIDLLFNWELKRGIFKVRSQVLRSVRCYLDNEGFLEVETPILDSKAGGAAAKPFVTHLNEMDMELRMRIAPELYLKQLIVSGFEKVYEMGKIFRNEGMDTTHNPEFTMVEFYEAYNDFEGLVSRTEQLLSHVVHDTKGSVRFKTTDSEGRDIELDFTPPFQRISYMDTLEKQLGQKIPKSTDESCVQTLQQLCQRHGISIENAHSYSTLIDKLVGRFVEPLCVQPTFIVDQPSDISPLAKPHTDRPELSQRFELFVLGSELCNAYVELNDPDVQRKHFDKQASIDAKEERHEKDDEFCRVLEYGLPPTVGFGCGVDRLVMLLTGQRSIREVQFFPLMKPVGQNASSAR